MKTLEEVMANLGVLKHNCGKAFSRLYLETPERIAKDMSEKVFAYTDELERQNLFFPKLVKFVESQPCWCGPVFVEGQSGIIICPRCALLEEVLKI